MFILSIKVGSIGFHVSVVKLKYSRKHLLTYFYSTAYYLYG